jgi:hypothetical protein
VRSAGAVHRLIFGRYSLVAEGFNRRAIVEGLRQFNHLLGIGDCLVKPRTLKQKARAFVSWRKRKC